MYQDGIGSVVLDGYVPENIHTHTHYKLLSVSTQCSIFMGKIRNLCVVLRSLREHDKLTPNIFRQLQSYTRWSCVYTMRCHAIEYKITTYYHMASCVNNTIIDRVQWLPVLLLLLFALPTHITYSRSVSLTKMIFSWFRSIPCLFSYICSFPQFLLLFLLLASSPVSYGTCIQRNKSRVLLLVTLNCVPMGYTNSSYDIGLMYEIDGKLYTA